MIVRTKKNTYFPMYPKSSKKGKHQELEISVISEESVFQASATLSDNKEERLVNKTRQLKLDYRSLIIGVDKHVSKSMPNNTNSFVGLI